MKSFCCCLFESGAKVRRDLNGTDLRQSGLHLMLSLMGDTDLSFSMANSLRVNDNDYYHIRRRSDCVELVSQQRYSRWGSIERWTLEWVVHCGYSGTVVMARKRHWKNYIDPLKMARRTKGAVWSNGNPFAFILWTISADWMTMTILSKEWLDL